MKKVSKINVLQVVAASFLFTFSAQSLFAQVKIGSNPTTINPANNLEVESADPAKKISINKTTGKLTIADGSQGVGKVLTSDAGGVGTWESSPASQVNFSVTFTGTQDLAPGQAGKARIGFATAETNDGNGFDLTLDQFVAPIAGVYAFSATIYVHGAVLVPGNYVDVLSLNVNGTPKLTQENWQYVAGAYGNAFGLTYMVRLAAGDIVALEALTSKPGAYMAGYANTINAPQTTFQGYLIGK